MTKSFKLACLGWMHQPLKNNFFVIRNDIDVNRSNHTVKHEYQYLLFVSILSHRRSADFRRFRELEAEANYNIQQYKEEKKRKEMMREEEKKRVPYFFTSFCQSLFHIISIQNCILIWH